MIAILPGDGLDIPAIMPVMADAFDPAFGEAWTAAQCLATLSMPGSQLWLASEQDRILGFALSRWVVDEEELLLIGVSPTARRLGVGRELVAALTANARDGGRSKIFLEVREGNPAQRFYQWMGFEPMSRRTGYYKAKDGSLHDSITMSLKL